MWTRSWGWDPSLTMKSIYVSYTPYARHQKVTSYGIFGAPVFCPDPQHEVRCGISHVCRHVSCFRTFWISDVWIRDVPSSLWKVSVIRVLAVALQASFSPSLSRPQLVSVQRVRATPLGQRVIRNSAISLSLSLYLPNPK